MTLQCFVFEFFIWGNIMNKQQATHARIRPTARGFGGGFRVTILAGSKMLASQHFGVPKSHRKLAKVWDGLDLAWDDAKKFAASFGVS